MAEQVNQRIEGMINELEQMRRTGLFDDEEIREISRKRKEFEYRIQRRIKEKDDFVHYIAYELALLENIAIRRKISNLGEKKKDIEYAIAKRVNKVFKQFIYRFQNDMEIYFQYIKFCRGVGFDYAVSGIIGQMLQMHGDKIKMWQLASKWESEEQNNLESARNFLLKGIHRHPKSECLYLDLFKIELIILFKAETSEDKDKQLKRVDVVWRNGIKDIEKASLICQLCDLSMLYECACSITEDIKKEIWSRRNNKEIWLYIAGKELEGRHWSEIEEFIGLNLNFPKEVNNYIAVFEEALRQFPEKKLETEYIKGLLGISSNICNDKQKINAVKHAWMYGHENGLLANDMYKFGIDFLKLLNELTSEELIEILDEASQRNPQCKRIWQEKLLLTSDDKTIMKILQDATKILKKDDALDLWITVLDNIDNSDTIMKFYKKFQNCDNIIVLSLKPKLLQKMHKFNGLKAARELYNDFIKTPPTQVEVHDVMIKIEKSEEKPNTKFIRKCYEAAVQHHGKESIELWAEYLKFESENGNAQATPAIYRRAVGTLKKELVDNFVKTQTLAKIQSL